MFDCVRFCACVEIHRKCESGARANDDLNEALRLHCVCDLQIAIFNLLLLFTRIRNVCAEHIEQLGISMHTQTVDTECKYRKMK